jgi:ABC-type Mn2+/Zn2+ transport system ATPase subunit
VSSRALVDVAGLDAGYVRGRPAIEGLTFAIEAGQSVAILGPNGGGKTTLFRALLGELPFVSGRVEIGAKVAYVPQTERARLDYPVNALDVVQMGTYASLPWHGRIGRAQRRSATDALARVGLEAQAAVPFGELSGGQRQRVLIARALAQEAGVVLLDEPLSGADLPSAERILGLIGELRDREHAVLVATHDITQARGLDRVLCVNRSQVAFGPPTAALSRANLERTYGAELIVLDGESAVVVDHHAH